MAIRIVKKAVDATTRTPAPIIPRETSAPSPAPQSPPSSKPATPLPLTQRPLAPSPQAFSAAPNKYRLPDATVCTFCKHPYNFPCHGKADNCMNAQFVRDRDATKS